MATSCSSEGEEEGRAGQKEVGGSGGGGGTMGARVESEKIGERARLRKLEPRRLEGLEDGQHDLWADAPRGGRADSNHACWKLQGVLRAVARP